MNNKNLISLVILLTFALTACSNATRAPAYEANKTPEERTLYTGYEGWAQRVDDDRTIQNQALLNTCRELYLEYQALNAEDDSDAQRSLRSFERRCPASVQSAIQ